MSKTKSPGISVPTRGRRRAENKPRRLARITSGLSVATGGRYRNAVVVASFGLLAAVGGGAAAGTGQVAPAAETASAPITATTDAKLDFMRPSVGSLAKPQPEQQAPVVAAATTVAPVAPAAPAAPAKPQPVNDPAAAQAYAATQLAKFGWGQDQMQSLITLWNRESDWKTTATNASSGAYGIAQALPAGKMSTSGGDWDTNYRTQIDWGLGYIKERYGSPANALAFHYAHNWY